MAIIAKKQYPSSKTLEDKDLSVSPPWPVIVATELTILDDKFKVSSPGL